MNICTHIRCEHANGNSGRRQLCRARVAVAGCALLRVGSRRRGTDETAPYQLSSLEAWWAWVCPKAEPVAQFRDQTLATSPANLIPIDIRPGRSALFSGYPMRDTWQRYIVFRIQSTGQAQSGGGSRHQSIPIAERLQHCSPRVEQRAMALARRGWLVGAQRSGNPCARKRVPVLRPVRRAPPEWR